MAKRSSDEYAMTMALILGVLRGGGPKTAKEISGFLGLPIKVVGYNLRSLRKQNQVRALKWTSTASNRQWDYIDDANRINKSQSEPEGPISAEDMEWMARWMEHRAKRIERINRINLLMKK